MARATQPDEQGIDVFVNNPTAMQARPTACVSLQNYNLDSIEGDNLVPFS